MTATPTAATTPEELADQTATSLFDGTIITESRMRDAIAAAIRQHSEGMRAEIERLKAENAALGVRHGIAKARAATAEAALAKVTAERDEAQAENERLTVLASRSELSASLERERAMLEALTKPGVLLFLDGRNEHGTHVLPLPMQTADVSGDDLGEQAEAITKAAEDAGYPVGSAVWCEFRHIKGQYDGMGRCEFPPGFEFVGIDKLLTEMFGGRPPEDDAALAAKETTDAE